MSEHIYSTKFIKAENFCASGTTLMRGLESLDKIGALFHAKSNGKSWTVDLASPIMEAATAACVSTATLNRDVVASALQAIFTNMGFLSVASEAELISTILATPVSKMKVVIMDNTIDKKEQFYGSLKFRLFADDHSWALQEVNALLERYYNESLEQTKDVPVSSTGCVFFQSVAEGGPAFVIPDTRDKDGKELDKAVYEAELLSAPITIKSTPATTTEFTLCGFQTKMGKKEEIKLLEGYLHASTVPFMVKLDKDWVTISGLGIDSRSHAWRWFYSLLGIVARKLLLAIISTPNLYYHNNGTDSMEVLLRGSDGKTINQSEFKKLIFDKEHAMLYASWANVMYGFDWMTKCVQSCEGLFILDVIANYPQSLYPMQGLEARNFYLGPTDNSVASMVNGWVSQTFDSLLTDSIRIIKKVRDTLITLAPHPVITTPGNTNVWTEFDQFGLNDAKTIMMDGKQVVWSRPIYNSNLIFVNGFEKHLFVVTYKARTSTDAKSVDAVDSLNTNSRTMLCSGFQPNFSVMILKHIKMLSGISDVQMDTFAQEGEYLIVAGPIKDRYAVEATYFDLNKLYTPFKVHGTSSVRIK